MTEKPRNIGDLADELISDVLSFLLGAEHLSNTPSPVNLQDPSRGLNGRSTHLYGEKSELDRFRLVCKRFLRISTPRKFPRFVLRFSSEGFQRLEELLRMQLACHVRYFTYMVRPFYQGSGWSQILDGVDSDDAPAFQILKARLQDQEYIIEGNHDLALLRRAIMAFTSLQQIKLLRLQDDADEKLLEYIRDRPPGGTEGLDWEPACTRAITTLGISLLASNCTSVRFVGPQISPEATVRLLQTPSATLSALGARLTCLDVTFHSKVDLTTHMETISNVFHDFFQAAKNLTAIHLGFATHTPLGLPLEQVFHRIQWKRLRSLSIQGWRLRPEEIIALIRRHRRQLCDIRLVSIYLQGGRWRDVLAVLHDEMDQLERIDLREINYASRLDADSIAPTSNGNNGTGSSFHHPAPLSIIVHPSPDIPLLPSYPAPPLHHTIFNGDYLSFSSRGNTRHTFAHSTLESLKTVSVDQLGDDGINVRHEQRLFWEAWVLSSPRKISRRKI